MKKILLVLTNIVTPGFTGVLQRVGYDVVEFRAANDDFDDVAAQIYEAIDNSFYGVFMYNFIPQIAKACYQKKVLYISWIVDAPCFALNSEAVKYCTNRIFTFEKNEVSKIKKRHNIDIYYQPLGTDVDFYGAVIRKGGLKDYTDIDVSFMGNLYNSTDRNLYLSVKYLPDYVRGYINGLVLTQTKLTRNIILPQLFTAQVEETLRKYINFDIKGYNYDYLEKIVEMLQREVTRIRRCQAVSILNHYFDFKLFTGSDTSFDAALKKERYIDYGNEMPLIFNRSKININLTLDSIETAIPLRAIDIMACGGFLLSDYCEDLAEYFIDGEECVLFEGFEDMVEKVDYYLKNDSARQKIAQKGHEKVAKNFNLEVQLTKIRNKLEELE